MKNFSDGINPSLIDDPIQRTFWSAVKEYLREQQIALARIIPAVNNPQGSVSTDVPVAPVINTRVQHTWNANGPYRVGTNVDGGYHVPTAMVISAIKLHRDTPGSSGSTQLDINRNGTSMYQTNPLSKPSLPFSLTAQNVVLPSEVSVAAGDIITIDIDVIEAGTPQNLTIVMEGS